MDLIIELLKNKDDRAIEMIDKLSDQDRKILRGGCLAIGIEELPRNLYYNYQTQEWID